jgi:hypothetical protein
MTVRNLPPQVLEVCKTPGCKYSSVRSAFEAITDSSATKRYVIEVGPGVYTETAVTTADSYVTLRGAGKHATRVTMSNAAGHIIEASSTTDLAIEDIWLDQQSAGNNFAINADNAVNLSIARCRLESNGVNVFDESNSSTQTLTVSDTEVAGSNGTSTSDAMTLTLVNLQGYNLSVNFTHTGNVVADSFRMLSGSGFCLGCNFSITPAATLTSSTFNTAANFAGGTGLVFSMIGGSIRADLTGGDANGSGVQVGAVGTSGNNDYTLTFIGTEITYKSGTITTAGRFDGMDLTSADTNAAEGTVNLYGVTITDLGGSGGTIRNDVVINTSVVGTTRVMKALHQAGSKFRWEYRVVAGSPVLTHSNYGTTETSLNYQTGTATFVSAATVAVTLPLAYESAPSQVTDYRVVLEPSANETFWVTAKTNSGFTLNSSNAASTAVVNYVVLR